MKSAAPSEPVTRSPRLQSLDALRGFDMFWIVGGAGLLKAIAAWSESDSLIAAVEPNIRHTPWVGMIRGISSSPLRFLSGSRCHMPPHEAENGAPNGSLIGHSR